jgi:pyruvate formate lyase activating enzyme
MDKSVIIRIPIIPGHNNSEENIRATAEFIKAKLSNNVLQVQLLPYRPLGLEKYESINIPYLIADLKSPDVKDQKKELDHLVGLMCSYGVPAVAGSSEKVDV